LKSDSLIIRKKYTSVEEIMYRALQKVTYLNHHQKPRIHVTLSEHTSDYSCAADADKLETVFINLLENATRYSHPSEISIILNGSDDSLSIAITNPLKEPVADAGSLSQEFKKSRELSVGLGMGLWICEQILKLHGGNLTLSSQDLTFTAMVLLPRNG
jgi:K+-sensing histidine kinase KdpD